MLQAILAVAALALVILALPFLASRSLMREHGEHMKRELQRTGI